MIESERRVCWAVIDRRQRMDRWIVYLGMAIMLAFLYLLYCASHTHYSHGALNHSSPQTSEKTTTTSFL